MKLGSVNEKPKGRTVNTQNTMKEMKLGRAERFCQSEVAIAVSTAGTLK